MFVPGLCPCVYFYILVLNESAANKLYQGLTVKPSLNKQDMEYSDAAVIRKEQRQLSKGL